MVNKISVSHLIWYLVPGLCLLAFVMLPMVAFCPQLLKSAVNTITPIGLLVLGVLCGFILDGLRIYRFRDGYNKIKNEFFKKLLNVFGLNSAYNPYFVLSIVNDYAAKDKNSNISLHHAIWIMHGTIAILSLMNSIIWLIIGVFVLTHDGNGQVTFFTVNCSWPAICIYCFLFAVIFFSIFWRINQISIEDQNTTNDMFLGYARSRKNAILEIIVENNNIDRQGS